MAHVPLIRLFLSSPGDVYEERAIVHEEIETLINRPAFREKVAFRVIAWDKKGAGTVMRFRMPPQEAINLGLPRPSECDIVVVIFWSRLGTPFTAADGQTYQSGTHYELLDALDSPRPEVVIYRRTETPSFDPDAADFDEKSAQYKRLKEFLRTAVFYDPQTGSPRGVSQHLTAEDFRIEFRTALEQLTLDYLARLGQHPVTAGPPTPPASGPPPEQITDISAGHWPGSPFPGLRAFTLDDAPIFFGRGREADAVVRRLAERRFVAVVGASGSGKSSLVAAGVIPRLLRRGAITTRETASEYWRVLRFTPASHDGAITASPLEALYYALLKAFPALVDHPLRAQKIKREFLDELRADPATLGEACAHLLADAPEGSEILLFIDQFEELFTQVITTDERRAFVEVLRAASAHPKLRVIATLRADFYPQCVELPALAALLQAGSFPLSTPTGGALYEMVQFPADRAALGFEDGLVARILKDTGESAGALALLAYALDELYQRAEARGDRAIRFDDYAALGGVEGAIGRRAEAVFAALDDETSDEADAQAREGALKALFHRLVSVSEDGTPTRQRVPYAPDEADPLTARLVKALTDARLLVMDTALAPGPEEAALATGDAPTQAGRGEKNRGVTLEVAHEALFRSWPRLREWIAEAQEDLILLRQARSAAHDWAAKRAREPEKDFDYLRWPQERLDLVDAMLARLNPTFDADERATFEAFIEPEAARLLRELEVLPKDATSHERRRDIGDRLAVIGDPRPGVGCVLLPSPDGRGAGGEGRLLPDILWLLVTPGGEIVIEDKTFTVQPFYVAKYLVTYPQFQAFVDAPDGFDDPRWWADMPEEYHRHGLVDQRIKVKNAPRDSVSWYQAVAFARWLDFKYREHKLFTALPEGDWQIRLPTEWEWGWMAQGGAQVLTYPWGADWREGYANTFEAGLSRTTAAGMYPHGAAACGALDMAGNLSEWCLNDYENPEIVDMNNEQKKVLRGGSFLIYRHWAAAASRDDNNPFVRNLNYGLRLVACPMSAY